MSLPTTEKLIQDWADKAKAHGADPVSLATGQAKAVEATALQLASALSGDERSQLHLEAQFALGKFSAEADGFVEARAWTMGLLDVLSDLAAAAIGAAAQGVAAGLANSLKTGQA